MDKNLERQEQIKYDKETALSSSTMHAVIDNCNTDQISLIKTLDIIK